MYGHPFLLENLPPKDPASLADYLPYLNLLRELLKEHTDQILSHPITISFKPRDLVLLQGSSTISIGTSMHWPSSGHSHEPTAVKLNGILQWHHLLRNGHLESSREQHFTVVLLANAHPNAYISCSPILKLPTCIILHVCYC
jgi:hypothetical protein